MYLDSLLSIFFTLYILKNVYKYTKETFLIFLQGVPKEMNIEEIQKKITCIKDVVDVHDIHFWSLDGENNICTMHIMVKNDLSSKKIQSIKCIAKEILGKKMNAHATIEIEQKGETCENSGNCYKESYQH